MNFLKWVVALLFLPCAALADSQQYPSRAVTVVVPYALSGPHDIQGSSRMTRTHKVIATHAPPALSDTLARVVQQAIQADSKHQVVLERQPGAATVRGAQRVARSVPDGYTLLLASNATMILAPHFLPGVGYHAARDFDAVAPLVNMSFVLLMQNGLRFSTLEQLLVYMRVRPGAVNYASSGEGSSGHLAGELFRRATGINIVHVSYNGGMSALNGLAMRQTAAMFAALPLALPYLNHEHMRALAIASPNRSEIVPRLPTLRESGIINADVVGWFGVFAPRGVSSEAMRWLSGRLGGSVNEMSTQNMLLALGLEPVPGTVIDFAYRIADECKRWGPVIQAMRPAISSMP